MRNKPFVFLLVLTVFLILFSAETQARTWYVPGDTFDVTEALTQAQSGDVVQIAIGHYKVVGRPHWINPGVIVRGESTLPGSVVLEEVCCFCGDWRDEPVFVINGQGQPTRFENITFSNFNLSCGPNPYASNPIFHILQSSVEFQNCHWNDFYKYALYIEDGRVDLADCVFAYGRGCPSAIFLGSGKLDIDGCTFHHNAWIEDCDQLRGSIIGLMGGRTVITNSTFCENGPLINLITVGPDALLNADCMCMQQCATIWLGRVEGIANLRSCQIDQGLWQVINGGQLHYLDSPDKALNVESRSWSQVKQLFD